MPFAARQCRRFDHRLEASLRRHHRAAQLLLRIRKPVNGVRGGLMSQVILPAEWRSRLAFENEIEDVPRPIVVRGHDYDTGFRTQPHIHSRSQLIFAAVGTMTVHAARGVWAVPPQRALWVPAGVEHAVEAHSEIRLRSIFVDPTQIQLRDVCMVSITPLLRELILHAADIPRLYPIGGPEDRMMRVLLDQLENAPVAPLYLPMPTDRRLLRISLTFLENTASRKSMRDWCREVGISERTLSRLFPIETGMNFRDWQQTARILEAVRRLMSGEPVAQVAEEVGYESPSAFIATFRRVTGRTPRQYLEFGVAQRLRPDGGSLARARG
ncbi:AraC family transcriptional regulator [Bradyrhizobium sp.]|uniref:AraC family transcriptional regulator n=1 Tax=Bradyrhizobium sp. TaxID=376 RepID=UPI0039E2EA44